MLTYDEERTANIERNKKLLVSLDLEKLRPAHEPKETRRPKNRRQPTRHKRKAGDSDAYSDAEQEEDEDETTSNGKAHARKAARVMHDENTAPASMGSQRRSSRIAGKPADVIARTRGTPQPLSTKNLVGEAARHTKRERRHNPKTYGAIPGIDVGSWWASREECSNDAIHAPWVGGIAPGPDGAYSVALSGGYDDDVDEGYAFTYTGAGTSNIHSPSGRDLKGTKTAPKNLRTAEQSFDQSFEHNHNRALKRSVETGKPVRVVRGFKLRSEYGPSEGYRYDGLYVVVRHWQEKGLNKGGFLVCKFAFVRLEGQAAIPRNVGGEEDDEEKESVSVKSEESKVEMGTDDVEKEED